MLLGDRKLEFSESKEEEWEELRSKIGDGVELPIEGVHRWFLATVEGDEIKIQESQKNVRPIKLYDTPMIDFDEFKMVADVYNELLEFNVKQLKTALVIKEKAKNYRFIFPLIYHLL